MRRAVLILPLLGIACTARAPDDTMAMVDNEWEANIVAPAPTPPQLKTVAGGKPPCARLREPCRMGERGTPQERCFEITAYLGDKRPGGRAVYAEPDAGARVLGHVLEPWKGSDQGQVVDVSFRVVDSRGGWLRIDGAGDDSVRTEAPERPMYHGKGWIRGEGVHVSLQGSQVFTAPDWDSALAFKVVSPRENGAEAKGWLDELRMVALTACDGSWVQGRWRVDDASKFRAGPGQPPVKLPGEVSGWATGVCENTDTTCDGLFGDKPGTY